MDQSTLQSALTTRINLQIVVSSIPSIDETMDLPLTRWLDSVPLPPERPSGTGDNLTVWLASDLSRLRWSAFGDPAGFIPKMADYFQKCAMSTEDLEAINEMGGALEPALVGSWVEVVNNTVRTGWQFRETMPLAVLAPHLGNSIAVTKLMSWTVKRDIEQQRRYERVVGKAPAAVVELVLPGENTAQQLALAAEGFKDLANVELPDAVVEVLSSADADCTLAMTIADDRVSRIAVSTPGLPADVLATLCNVSGVPRDDTIGQIQRILKASGLNRVVYHQPVGDSTAAEIDVELVPNQVAIATGFERN